MRRLGIVIPTHNRAASLRRTLSSVTRQQYAGSSPEIIVVNNNSSDETPQVCAEFAPAVRMVNEPRQGLSYARNTGIASLQHFDADDVIAFIDDDIEAGPDWGAQLAAAFDSDPSVDCAGGRVLASDPGSLPAWLTPEHWGPLALQDHGAGATDVRCEHADRAGRGELRLSQIGVRSTRRLLARRAAREGRHRFDRGSRVPEPALFAAAAAPCISPKRWSRPMFPPSA